jgi:hypothetical protein
MHFYSGKCSSFWEVHATLLEFVCRCLQYFKSLTFPCNEHRIYVYKEPTVVAGMKLHRWFLYVLLICWSRWKPDIAISRSNILHMDFVTRLNTVAEMCHHFLLEQFWIEHLELVSMTYISVHTVRGCPGHACRHSHQIRLSWHMWNLWFRIFLCARFINGDIPWVICISLTLNKITEKFQALCCKLHGCITQ